MYWEWAALSLNGSSNAAGGGNGDTSERTSVLDRLPTEAAKDVVGPVVRHIVTTLGISQPAQPSGFASDAEVEWALQVICYGLSLPLSDHEIIKDCVNIYCEWLSCLAPITKISTPKPIADRPNFYARKMINHLYHLFTPRKGEVQDTINRQAVLCHRALRTLQNLVKTSEILESQTWECILLFFIAINDALLSPPTIKEDIGDQLCERVLSALFEVWLLACGKAFPSPSLWKTLRESCKLWRHRPNLFDQWNRINLQLTGHILRIMYGPDYIKFEEDPNLFSTDMTNDCVVQSWFRFLHCLGNPVELTQPTLISQTQNFLQYAIASKQVIDPCQHPCLLALPSIFHQAMKGIAALVDAFLGISPASQEPRRSFSPEIHPIPSPVPPMRRLAKSFSVAQSSHFHRGLSKTSLLGLAQAGPRSKETPAASTSSSSIQTTASSNSLSIDANSFLRTILADGRPKVNSILHLFGPWLFEAALAVSEFSVTDDGTRRRSRGSSIPAALPESVDIPQAIALDKYFFGRAEALGTLCRIFCSKKTGEEILPAYLARFYIAIRKGLKDSRNEVLTAILSNSANLMRVDLDGVSMLAPIIVSALEVILPSKDAVKGELRRSAIQLLLSLLPLPLHFLKLPVKDLGDKNGPSSTFLQLKPRLANLLINALQVETDSMNIHMLLGGLIMFVLDTSFFEEADSSHANLGAESPTNILSSENASIRSTSEYGNSFDEHTYGLSDSIDGQLDSAHALFVRATYLVCHRLISVWKVDLPVSLAAVELLNGLARAKIIDQDPLECRRAVKWVCDFIIQQCSRPPPAHSKDLHSIIVAAFNCVSNWLTEHPDALEDKDTIATVLEVVEYGISGTKSQGKPRETSKLKDEKELKPVSLRVKDAAESLLASIFEQVGPVSRSASSTGIDAKSAMSVDEASILNMTNPLKQVTLSKEEAIGQFRYFVIDNTILAAFYEGPEGNDPGSAPTVTTILRGPTGRHAWTLQLRHVPLHKGQSFSAPASNPGRPLPMTDLGHRYDIQHRYFPPIVDRITMCKADKAIPQFGGNDGSSNSESLEESRLSMILQNQVQLEKSVAKQIQEESEENYPNLRTECIPPPAAQEFQTARLLLSHLGFISNQVKPDFAPPRLAWIDSKHPDFVTELDLLDSTSCRTNDTVHIFYVRAGQKKASEILANVQTRNNVHPHFLEFLLSLGWPVNVNAHTGWTGHVSTSWTGPNTGINHDAHESGTKSTEAKLAELMHGGSVYDGTKQVLYWADGTAEIAFVVPSGKSSQLGRNDTALWNKSGSSSFSADAPKSSLGLEPQKLTSEQSRSAEPTQADQAKKAHIAKLFDTKIFVVWIESFEDALNFPAADLLNSTSTGLESSKPSQPSLIIFMHALKNGLFRIHMEGDSLRMGLAVPLIDGMVISRRMAGNLVRQTALNMARRKRLETETSHPPYVRRKHKIQEILNKFPCAMSEPEFYTHFYTNPETSS